MRAKRREGLLQVLGDKLTSDERTELENEVSAVLGLPPAEQGAAWREAWQRMLVRAPFLASIIPGRDLLKAAPALAKLYEMGEKAFGMASGSGPATVVNVGVLGGSLPVVSINEKPASD